MDQESVREYCLSLPHATENVQWGNDLVFKIGGKMFAVVVLDNASPHAKLPKKVLSQLDAPTPAKARRPIKK